MALLLVMVVVSVGTLLALRILQASTMRAVLSQNLLDARRAQHVAESGLAEAAWWLRHPDLTGGTAWEGVANRTIPGSTDYYSVTVTPKSGASHVYSVTSQGHALDAAGARMTRTVSADFRLYHGFPDAVTTPNSLLLPAAVRITGDVYAFGGLDNRAVIRGHVWTGGICTNTGTITGRTHLGTASRNLGSYVLALPLLYTYDGLVHLAGTILTATLSGASFEPGLANPMGVHSRLGDLSVFDANRIDGTLVVSGDLCLTAGSSLEITPKAGFPALVVGGRLILQGDSIAATLNGIAVVHGLIQTSGAMPNTRIAIRGGLLLPDAGSGFDPAFSSDPEVHITYDPSRADISGLYPSQPLPAAGLRLLSYQVEEP